MELRIIGSAILGASLAAYLLRVRVAGPPSTMAYIGSHSSCFCSWSETPLDQECLVLLGNCCVWHLTSRMGTPGLPEQLNVKPIFSHAPMHAADAMTPSVPYGVTTRTRKGMDACCF